MLVHVFFTAFCIYQTTAFSIDGATSLYEFWQLTDVHWDYLYSSSGDPKKMCRNLPDSTKNAAWKRYPYGTYTCESPWTLVDLSIRAMKAINKNPDFILWTGDNTAHFEDSSKEFDWSVVFSAMKKVGEKLKETFPTTKIIPILGNHDAYLPNLYPSGSREFYKRYLQDGGLENILPDEETRTMFSECGFYNMKHRNLKIIVLNTNLYNIPDNFTSGEFDPCHQFVWLETELQLARSNYQKVLITAHIPPGFFERRIGIPFYEHDKNKHYVNLMRRYGDVIVSQIYGHTHTDSFRIIKDRNSKKVESVAFLSPAITPWLFDGGINPGIRLYKASTNHILDYSQYYLNISKVDPEEDNPKWGLLYQATKSYDLPNLSPQNMDNFYQRLFRNTSLFSLYFYHNTVGNVYKSCNESCVRDHLCAISHLHVEDMQICQQGTNLYLDSIRLPYPVIIIIVGISILLVATAFILLVRYRTARRYRTRLPLINEEIYD